MRNDHSHVNKSFRQSTMVGRQFIRCTPRHEKSLRHIYADWEMRDIHILMAPKLNKKSSTEAELIAKDEPMGQILWTRHFLAA